MPCEEFYSLKVLLLKLIKQNIGFATISCIILSHILHWISARIPDRIDGQTWFGSKHAFFLFDFIFGEGEGCCRGPLVWSISLDLKAFTNAYYSLFRYKYHSRKMT